MYQLTFFLSLKLVRLLLGILAFIGLFSLDVWKAWKSKAHWVPQGALVLSAFSLQLLDLLDTDNVNISDYPNNQRWDLERVLRNGLFIDGGRVMVCVYMGYLLPEMARSPSQRVVWSDIGALALSLTTHIFSELYVIKQLCSNTRQAYIQEYESQGYVQQQYASEPKTIIPLNRLSILSRLCTGLCALLLFLILGSAAFAGRSLYNFVWEKIPLALEKKPPNNYSPDNIEQDVLESWVVAWVCKPDYVIARSALASSVGVVVTISVVGFAAEWTTQNYQVLHSNDGIDWLRYTVTAFITLLILMGWGIIFYRWMFAIFYFPGKHKIRDVEDFWIRHIYEVMNDIQYPRQSWDARVSGGGFLENMLLHFLRKFKVHKLLRHPLLCLQRRVIWFSKCCCLFSEKIFFVHKTRSCVVGGMDRDLSDFRQVLEKVKVTGETEEFLLAGSFKALKQTKDFMKKGRKEGTDSKGLIEFLTAHSPRENTEGKVFLKTLEECLGGDLRFEYLRKFSWKMTALSLIQVIIQLEGRGATDAVDAYSQAYDFLELLDNPAGTDNNFLPELLDRASDIKFTDIKQQLERNGGAIPPESGTIQVALQRVTDLQQNVNTSSNIPHDTVDWWAVAADNCLDKVCTIILGNDTNLEPAADCTAFTNRVRKILADILAVALNEKVGIELVNNCREWAKLLDVENIKASVYIAGKLNGVLKQLSEAVPPETVDGCLGVSNLNAFNIRA